MKRDRSELRLLAPMTVVVVAAVCALVGSLWVWAGQTDDVSRLREESLVRAGIHHMIEENAQVMTSTTTGDNAVRYTGKDYRHDWVKYNYGEYYRERLGYDRTFLIDGQDQPIFAYARGDETDRTEYDAFKAQLQPLITSLRTAYIEKRNAKEIFTASDNRFGRLMTVGGRIYIFAASPILSDAQGTLNSNRPHVVLAARELSREELDELAHQYKLAPIHMVRANQIVPEGNARVAFNDDDGKVITELTWKPETPGQGMFMRALGPVLLISCGLGAIALMLLHQSQRAARNLIASEARAKHMALHDALTGLPNRTLFADRLVQATERIRRQGGHVAVFCIGLDRFKDVNDTLGHTAGDELIRFSANKISTMIRSGDTLARLGGDEFVVIQTDTDPHSAAALAKRILEGLSGNVSLESGQVYSSCSIGVTVLQEGDIDPAEALRQADLALYRAKELGRAQYAFFEVEMDATIKLRKLLETGLREAIHVEAIEVVYQPQVDHFGHIVGVEALARWNHPVRGPISPAYFIPLAEECGLMIDLGAQIMRRAMIDSKRWPGVKVAVNVSATQLKGPKFLSMLQGLLDETGVEASRIEIEITEGVLLNDDHTTQIILRDLRHMGFSIALDDFGTGYSSLGYLSRYPVDKIKIDRSFVSNLGVDPEAEAVVRAIIKLAKALNLNIVAEGVETKGQRSILRSAGCPIIQGYLFSKPVSIGEIDMMMDAQVTHISRASMVHKTLRG